MKIVYSHDTITPEEVVRFLTLTGHSDAIFPEIIKHREVLKKAKELDGIDLIPYLTGEKGGLPKRELYWRFWDQSAVRDGKWKLLKAGLKLIQTKRYLQDWSSKKSYSAV